MLELNNQLAIPMIEAIQGRCYKSDSLADLVESISFTIGADLKNTLLSGNTLECMSVSALKDVLSSSAVRSSPHQEDIFTRLVCWASTKSKTAIAKKKHKRQSSSGGGSSPHSSRHADAVYMAENCLCLERMAPTFLANVVKPSGLVSEGALTASSVLQTCKDGCSCLSGGHFTVKLRIDLRCLPPQKIASALICSAACRRDSGGVPEAGRDGGGEAPPELWGHAY